MELNLFGERAHRADSCQVHGSPGPRLRFGFHSIQNTSCGGGGGGGAGVGWKGAEGAKGGGGGGPPLRQ